MEHSNSLKALEHARSIVYRQLADAYRLPDINLFHALPEIERALARLDSDALPDARRFTEAYAQMDNKNALKVEHTRLFVGPFLALAPPYGSVYLEQGRRLMGDSTINARQYYLMRGVDIASNVKESPDHISIELEFMYVLVCQGLEAINVTDYASLSQILCMQMEFLQNHLGAWIPDFTKRIAKYTRASFYWNLASATKAFIAEDMSLLADLSYA